MASNDSIDNINDFITECDSSIVSDTSLNSFALDFLFLIRVEDGDIQFCERLINKVDVNKTRNWDGETSLGFCCKKGNLEMVKFLVENNADVNQVNKLGWTPLRISCINDNYEIAKFLVENNADINKADNRGLTPLLVSCKNLELVKFLVENKADINKADKCGCTPLYISCADGHFESVKYLVENNADINKADNSYGLTPLHVSSENGHLEIVKFLVRKNANINKRDQDGSTSLYFSCRNGHLEIAKFLLENNANINQADSQSRTPLYISCKNDCLEIAKTLVEHNADINKAESSYGWTPLHISCENGLLEIVKFLVENNADINQANNMFSRTPLQTSCNCGHLEIVRFLVENNAEINQARSTSETPLHFSCENGHLDIAKLLVKNGADVSPAMLNDGRIVRYLFERNIGLIENLDTEIIGLSFNFGTRSFDQNKYIFCDKLDDYRPLLSYPYGEDFNKRGSFGEVRRVMFKNTEAAEKRIRLNVMHLNKTQMDTVSKAAELWAGIHHKNIIILYAFFIHIDNDYAYLTMEFANAGSLKEFIQPFKEKGGLPTHLQCNIMIDIAEAFEYLHTCKPNPLVHRDVKSDNILIAEKDNIYVAKLTDFDFLREFSFDLDIQSSGGNLAFTAPEIWEDLPKDLTKADIYALAFVFWEIGKCESVLLFHGFSGTLGQTIFANKCGRPTCWRPTERPKFFAPSIWELVKMCWQDKPSLRPSATEIVQKLKEATIWGICKDVQDLLPNFKEVETKSETEKELYSCLISLNAIVQPIRETVALNPQKDLNHLHSSLDAIIQQARETDGAFQPSNKHSNMIALKLHNIGDYFIGFGEFRKGILYHNYSIKVMEAIFGEKASEMLIANSENSLGICYSNVGYFKSAIEHYMTSINMKRALKQKPGLIGVEESLEGTMRNLKQCREKFGKPKLFGLFKF